MVPLLAKDLARRPHTEPPEVPVMGTRGSREDADDRQDDRRTHSRARDRAPTGSDGERPKDAPLGRSEIRADR